MRLAGFLLMPSGWIIVIAAIMLLPAAPSRGLFSLAGIGIEILGLIVVFRSHVLLPGDKA